MLIEFVSIGMWCVLNIWLLIIRYRFDCLILLRVTGTGSFVVKMREWNNLFKFNASLLAQSTTVNAKNFKHKQLCVNDPFILLHVLIVFKGTRFIFTSYL